MYYQLDGLGERLKVLASTDSIMEIHNFAEFK